MGFPHSNSHIDFDCFTLLEAEIQLLLRFGFLLFYLLLVLHPLEVVLQRYIKIKRVGTIAKPKPKERRPTCRRNSCNQIVIPYVYPSMPIPLSSCTRITKYLELSDTASIATPGYVSMGQFANNAPDVLSSSFRLTVVPFATSRIRPVHVGSPRFQSAALQRYEMHCWQQKGESVHKNVYFLFNTNNRSDNKSPAR